MLVSEALNRFRRDFIILALSGLFAGLLQTALGYGMMAALAGSGAVDFLHIASGQFDPEQLISMLKVAASSLLWILPVALAACLFVQAGMLGVIAAVMRHESPGAAAFWTEGARNWWRMVKIFAATLLASLALTALILALGALLGLLKLQFMIIVLAVLIVPPFSVAFGNYASYGAISEGAGGSRALSIGWHCFTRGFVECWAALLVIFGLALLGALPVALISFLPYGSVISWLVQQLVLLPFFFLYVAVRYEARYKKASA